MAGYKNTSGAVFTLPDGRNVGSGETVDLDADTLANAGVSQFIAAGKLVEVEPDKPKRGKVEKTGE